MTRNCCRITSPSHWRRSIRPRSGPATSPLSGPPAPLLCPSNSWWSRSSTSVLDTLVVWHIQPGRHNTTHQTQTWSDISIPNCVGPPTPLPFVSVTLLPCSRLIRNFWIHKRMNERVVRVNTTAKSCPTEIEKKQQAESGREERLTPSPVVGQMNASPSQLWLSPLRCTILPSAILSRCVNVWEEGVKERANSNGVIPTMTESAPLRCTRP